MIKLFRSLLLLAALLLGWQRPGTAQVFEWAKVARKLTSGSTTTQPVSATDAAGNTYTSVQFQGQLQIGTQTLTNPGGTASALVKYAPDGQITWIKTLTGIGVEQVAVDPVTNGLYCSGTVQSGASWDGAPVSSSGPYFYGKASASGTLLWLNSLPDLYVVYNRVYTPNNFYFGLNMTADGLGNVYVMGCLTNPGTVGGTALNNQTMFLLQANGNGTTQWVRQFHDNGVNSRSGLMDARLAPKPTGGCLVTGRFWRTIYFQAGTTGPSISPVSNGQDGLLANIDAAGTLLWSRLINGNASSFTYVQLNAAAADANGNCYVTGGSDAVTNFGSSNTPAGFVLAKYDAAGSLAWARGQQTNTGSAGGFGTQLITDAAGTTISVVVRDTATISFSQIRPPVTIGSLRMVSAYNVVRFNNQGQPLWAVGDTRVLSGNHLSVPFFRSANLGTDGSGNLYWSGDISVRNGSVPATVTTSLGSQTVVGNGIVLARLENQSNALVGDVYADLNGNGQRDTGELPYTRSAIAQVTQNGIDTFYPLRTDGQLQAFAAPGAYSLTLTPGSLPRYYTISQPAGGSYTGSFSGSTQIQTGQTFGIAPLANQPDVRISLTPYTPVRPGFLTRYRLTVENVGTTTASGSVTATLDSRMTYVSAVPTGTQSGTTLTWSYAGLAPQGILNYDVQFSLPINVALGTVLTHTAAVTLAGDLTPTDNSLTTQQTVVGSYDPNDISVNYAQLTLPQLAARQPLDYTIRFQNMGTDTAFAVVVQDTLDARLLQLNTLQLVVPSHNCTWELSRQGVITLRLLGAKLPPRSTNVLASQGFVVFRVTPRTTLTPGSVIPNRGHITFDYNAPIRTNTATTTILGPTAIRSGQTSLSWDAYPNPTTGTLTVSAAMPAGSAVTLELLDALGRPVRQQPLTATSGGLQHTLDVHSLPAGLYLLRLRTPQGLSTSRTIVRQ